MAELIDALDDDFEGERGEEIRQLCLAAPKYGNDIDEVDRLAGELGAFGGRTIQSHKMPTGEPIEIERPGVSWHYFGGAMTAALPNGRKAREPLNDATLSPMRGQDKQGPTTVFRSVIKAGFRESLYNVLNQRISPSAVRSPESMGKLVSLTQAYMENGGMHVQYNIVDTETMRRAQQTPEEYKDLVVRIGGFSAYFVQLTKSMQDDVIMRNEQGV
jgi:formate C-acetyltransferase